MITGRKRIIRAKKGTKSKKLLFNLGNLNFNFGRLKEIGVFSGLGGDKSSIIGGGKTKLSEEISLLIGSSGD